MRRWTRDIEEILHMTVHEAGWLATSRELESLFGRESDVPKATCFMKRTTFRKANASFHEAILIEQRYRRLILSQTEFDSWLELYGIFTIVVIKNFTDCCGRSCFFTPCGLQLHVTMHVLSRFHVTTKGCLSLSSFAFFPINLSLRHNMFQVFLLITCTTWLLSLSDVCDKLSLI